MNEDLSSSRLERAWELPEEVVMTRPVVETAGLQPEDLGVLAALLLRDPRLPSTLDAIRKDLQAAGWKMGKDRFAGVVGRLKKAGHIAHLPVFDEETQRPTWITRVFRNPANNQQYVDLGIAGSLQAGGGMRENSDPAAGRFAGSLETRVSPGRGRNAENPPTGSGSRLTSDRQTRVSPGQRQNADESRYAALPPTPPYGEEDSSSLPSSASDGSSRPCAAEVSAAEEFLAELPGRWACGRKTAASLAALLAGTAARQGWTLGEELVEELTRRTSGRRTAAAVLRDRIEDLPRFRARRRALAPEPYPGRPAHPADAHRTAGAGLAGAVVTHAQVERARELLLTLSGPWVLAPESAARIAPVLAARAQERGWELDQVLRAQLMSNPDGINNYELTLETVRVGRLPYRRPASAAGAAEGGATGGSATGGGADRARPVAAWCEHPDCDSVSRLRTVRDEDGFQRSAPCPLCCPTARAGAFGRSLRHDRSPVS
ncbi:hypothetical protein ACFVYD_36080 [Streptomyces sp. NPDC058301]|uniref:hypothetical protein n=1 Tax=Streptomyces sp. NPDC058301 TaxID=3346436 RepID=UPI0036E2BDCF